MSYYNLAFLNRKLHCHLFRSKVHNYTAKYTQMCIAELNKQWTASNQLKQHSDKTQLIWLGPWQQLGNITMMQILLKDYSIVNCTVSCVSVLLLMLS